MGTDKVLRNLCTMVQNSAKELQSIKKVVQISAKDTGKSTGAPANQGSSKSNSGKVDLSTVQCYKCKGFGHYQKYCKNPRAAQSATQTQTKAKLN